MTDFVTDVTKCALKASLLLRDPQIGEYRVVHAGNRSGTQLWKLIGQEVTAEVVNEHHEHRGDVQSHVHSPKLLEGHHKMWKNNILPYLNIQIFRQDVQPMFIVNL